MLASPGLLAPGSLSLNSIYGKMWVGLTGLDRDPHPEVAQMSRNVTEYIRLKVKIWSTSSFFHLCVFNPSYVDVGQGSVDGLSRSGRVV
jgi:hypothetical protein